MGKYTEFETRTQPWFDESKFDGFNFAIPMKTLGASIVAGLHTPPRTSWRARSNGPPQTHGEHERRIGQKDPNWPAWYAEYMVSEQAGKELPR